MELTVPYKILCIGSQNAPSFDDPQFTRATITSTYPKTTCQQAATSLLRAIIHAVTDVQSEKSKIRAFLSESIGVA
jgi:hypothetical protein